MTQEKITRAASGLNGSTGDLPMGYDHKYIYSQIGYNVKLTDMQAAIGLAQLSKLPGFIEKRKIILINYLRDFQNIQSIFRFQLHKKVQILVGLVLRLS